MEGEWRVASDRRNGVECSWPCRASGGTMLGALQLGHGNVCLRRVGPWGNQTNPSSCLRECNEGRQGQAARLNAQLWDANTRTCE
jgi:hypothetical protein